MGGTSKELGESIQAARKTAGMTQQQLCVAADLSYSTLAKIERGAIASPSVFTVQRIAEVLGISMDNLLGAVVHTGVDSGQHKKTSKTGVKFVYFDINGCLVRFFHGAFTQIAHDTGVQSDVIESTFWHYNDAVCRGEMDLAEFNKLFAEKIGVTSIDWQGYYLAAIEPIEEMVELVSWAAKHYRVGLLSNIMPGFIDEMTKRSLLPNIHYDAVIDSSQVGAIKPEEAIYMIAQGETTVQPEEILFIDDSRTNLMAAEKQSWKVLWFDSYRPAQSAERIKSALAF